MIGSDLNSPPGNWKEKRHMHPEKRHVRDCTLCSWDFSVNHKVSWLLVFPSFKNRKWCNLWKEYISALTYLANLRATTKKIKRSLNRDISWCAFTFLSPSPGPWNNCQCISAQTKILGSWEIRGESERRVLFKGWCKRKWKLIFSSLQEVFYLSLSVFILSFLFFPSTKWTCYFSK